MTNFQPDFPANKDLELRLPDASEERQSEQKNIVLCCDGTANQFSPDRTNVIKLHYTLDLDRPGQIAFYHPGLGTMEPPGALTPTSRAITRGLGLALGYGLSNDIKDAYTFLMNNYEQGDNVYLFGFSRGAYTARAVCSLLAMYGLIRPGNEPLVPYAVRMMMAINEARTRRQTYADGDPEHAKEMERYFQLASDFKRMMCRTECNPRFVGVWDTVSSVGWISNPLKVPYTADNPFIRIGRHAVAIDERRAFFRTNLWMPSREMPEHGPADLKQVWFAGVHSDVGGGYPEAESGLSKVALEWMLQEAKAAGLRLNPNREAEVLGRSADTRYAPPDANGLMHDSLTGAWKLAEWIPKPHYDFATHTTRRRANRGRRRTIPQGAWIHASVFERENGAYAQRIGLPEEHTVERTSGAAT